MNERFWAPTRATITPDAVAVALLSPHGGDRANDLGASLLGMHRAGAAACEVVAKGAVPSEHGLLEALATCRAQMGGQAADAVAKSMEERYAGLLVRDLLDAAETTAAGLFRACVTKGVAPPLAASRVGAVYGVPTSELGRYRAMASDPRVNPLALTDAADRALLSYVAKVVATEVGEVKEEVSKAVADRGRARASVTETDAGWEAREHPRDTTTGQFVRSAPSGAPPVKEEQPEQRPKTALERARERLGLGTESAPEVVVAPTPVATPPQKPARQQRQQRQQRQKRQQRKPIKSQLQPTGLKADSGLKAGGGLRAGGTMRAGNSLQTLTGMKSASIQATQALRAKLGMIPTIEQQREASKDLVIPHGRTRTRPDDLMDLPIPTGTIGQYDESKYAPLVWSVGQGEGLDFRIHMHGTGLHDDPLRFRAGWLVEVAGQPETKEERIDGKRTEAENRLDHAAAIQRVRVGDIGVDQPIVTSLNAKAMSSQDYISDSYVKGVIEDLARAPDWVDPDDKEAVKEEARNIELMTDIATQQEVLVHWQPAKEADGEVRHPYRRPQPVVEMFVLQGESFRGRLVEGGTPGSINDQFLIDPNQALTLSEEFVPYWDSQRQVVIHVYQLRPISDAEANELEKKNKGGGFHFGKAVQDRGRLRGRQAVEFEHQHPRDTEGKFAPKAEGTSSVAPTALPTPVERARARLGLDEVDVQPAQQVQRPQQRQRRARRQQRQKRKAIVVRPASTVAPSGLVASQQMASGAQLKARSQMGQRSALKGASSLRTQQMMHSVSQIMAERAEALPDLPRLMDTSGFVVANKGDWGEALEVLSDDNVMIISEEGGVIPFRGLFRNRLMGDAKKLIDFDKAQASLINAATDDLWNNTHDIIDKPLGKPFSLKGGKALGHHIVDAFDENPKIDQISVFEDPSTGWVQLYGNARPVAKQYLIEIDEGIDLSWEGLTLINAGEYRTKNVTVESNGELLPLVPAEIDPGAGIGAMSLPVQIFRVIAPKVALRRVATED